MGDYATNKLSQNKGLELLKGLPGAVSSKGTNDVLQKYGSGGMSLQEALQAMRYNSNPEYKQGFMDQAAKLREMIQGAEAGGDKASGAFKELGSWKGQLDGLEAKIREIDGAPQYDMGKMLELYSNPLTADKAATEQVRGNDLFKGMFGEGGIQDQRQAEEKQLASRGYSLQPEDYEAYGQASDEIARLFGQQETSLAQALANKGLASAPSGAAAVSFSGLMGNKNEQLASQQRKIAQQRMETNMQRLNAVRGAVDSANQQAQGALNSQRASNQQGRDNYYNTLKDSVTAGATEQDQLNKEHEQFQASQGPSFGEVLGGIGGGLAGAVGGGLGTGLGGALGKKWAGGK